MKDEYLERILDLNITESLVAFGAVLIEGPKWCGKTRTGKENSKSVLSMQDPDKSSNYLKITFLFAFLFGLIHGLGFSSYFKILVDDFENKLFPLIEFALGIEIAQIIVTLFILILNYSILNIFKRQKREWIIIVSSIVIGIVIPMLVERKFW